MSDSSHLSCLASDATSLSKSSLNVQQIQPLLISISFSSWCWTCGWTKLPSMFNSLISFTMTAYRFPLWSLFRMCCSNVVLPAPRKPESTVTGSFLNGVFVSSVPEVTAFKYEIFLPSVVCRLLHLWNIRENDFTWTISNKLTIRNKLLQDMLTKGICCKQALAADDLARALSRNSWTNIHLWTCVSHSSSTKYSIVTAEQSIIGWRGKSKKRRSMPLTAPRVTSNTSLPESIYCIVLQFHKFMIILIRCNLTGIDPYQIP